MGPASLVFNNNNNNNNNNNGLLPFHLEFFILPSYQNPLHFLYILFTYFYFIFNSHKHYSTSITMFY